MLRFAMVLVCAAACGPTIVKTGLAPAKAELVDAVDRKDVNTIAARFAVPFEYAGMYFADPGCAKQFAAPQQIGADKRRAFAECLAAIPLRTSPREGAMRGLVVLDYAPGIEIEVMFRARAEGTLITWIGYAGRHAAPDDLPTVTPGALEVGRIEGDPVAALSDLNGAAIDAESKERGWKYAYAWLRVCLDAEGAVSSIEAREVTSPRAEAAFRTAIGNWKFKPVMLGETATPVCSFIRFVYPLTDEPEVMPLAFAMPAGAVRVPLAQLERVAGDAQIVPDDRGKTALQQSGIEALVGAFRFCFDPTGAVTDVETLESTGLDSYDAQIRSAMATWRYRPYVVDGKPVVGCSAVSFVYTQSS